MMINIPKYEFVNLCNNANKHVKKNFSSKIINNMYYEIIKAKL